MNERLGTGPEPRSDAGRSLFSDAELWMIYDQVVSVTERLQRAADEAMVETGARPWRDLRDKIRVELEARHA